MHLHQQATNAINFKIISTLLLGTNDKIEDNWKHEFLNQRLYLATILVKVDEPRTRNMLRPYRRESPQYQVFELNQPTSVPPLHIGNIGHLLTVFKGLTLQNIFEKIHNHAINCLHLFDQTSINRPLNSNVHSHVNLCNHETIWSKSHRHIATYFPHMLHVVKWQEQVKSTSETTAGTAVS